LAAVETQLRAAERCVASCRQRKENSKFEKEDSMKNTKKAPSPAQRAPSRRGLGRLRSGAFLVSIFAVLLLAAPRMGYPVFGIGDIVYLIELVSKAKAQLNQLEQTYSFYQQEYQSLAGMPSRYRSQFTSWLQSWAPSHYGNTGGMVNVLNSGSDPTSAYGGLTTPLQVYTGDSRSGLSLDELNRVKQLAARVDLRDGNLQSLFQTIGLARQNNQQVSQQLANLQNDSLADGQTQLAVEQRTAVASVMALEASRDAQALALQTAQLQALESMERREQLVEASNEALWLHQASAPPTQNWGSEMNAWRLNP
jgi:hypothetical protein